MTGTRVGPYEIVVTYDGPDTMVTITDGRVRRPKAIATGIAYCNTRLDQFKHSTGRKIALGRALIATGLDYWERQAFWEEYFKKFPGEKRSRERIAA